MKRYSFSWFIGWLIFGLILAVLSGCDPGPEEESLPGDTTASVEDTVGSGDESSGGARGSDSLPPEVASTRQDILQAARVEDFEALQAIIDEAPHFNYTFGSAHPGGAVGYWEEYREGEDQPFDRLEALLQLDAVLQDSLYVWPSWTATPLDSLTAEEREEMVMIMGEEMAELMMEQEYYLGYRTAISLGGDWIYFVAGD